MGQSVLPVLDVVRVAVGAEDAAEEAVLARGNLLSMREDAAGVESGEAAANEVLHRESGDGIAEALGRSNEVALEVILTNDGRVLPVVLGPVARNPLKGEKPMLVAGGWNEQNLVLTSKLISRVEKS
jgi:hypothetical protein